MPKNYVNAFYTYTDFVEVRVPIEDAELEILRNPENYTEEVYQAVREAFEERANEIIDGISKHLSDPMDDAELFYAEEYGGDVLFET